MEQTTLFGDWERTAVEQAAHHLRHPHAQWQVDPATGTPYLLFNGKQAWQPLLRTTVTDRLSDAMRLALHCGFQVTAVESVVQRGRSLLRCVVRASFRDSEGKNQKLRVTEEITADPEEAICKAIVLAAARITVVRKTPPSLYTLPFPL